MWNGQVNTILIFYLDAFIFFAEGMLGRNRNAEGEFLQRCY